MEDLAVGRVDQQRIALCNRVRQRQVADAERPDLHVVVAFAHDVQGHLVLQACFLQLAADQFGGEGRGVQRHTEVGREVRHRADMIFVRVGQHDAEQVLGAFLDKFEIGENQFDSRIFVGTEGHAQIYHQPLAVAAVEVDVHPDFARSTERKKQELVLRLEVLFHIIL